jgi:hypothetical protein
MASHSIQALSLSIHSSGKARTAKPTGKTRTTGRRPHLPDRMPSSVIATTKTAWPTTRSVDPEMYVNIEHEDVSLGREEGVRVAAEVLKAADAAL